MIPRPLIPAVHLDAPPSPERRFRFMEIVRRKIRERRYSRRTEEAYVYWIRRYIVDSGRRHPSDLTEADVARFLSRLAVERVRRLLAHLPQPQRLCAMLMYGGGLRLLECLRLRVKDVGVDRREITVRGGKGDKDRRAPLPDACTADLAKVLALRFAQFQRDLRNNVATTELPPGLRRKYPSAEREWTWSYIFAATRSFVDGEKVRRRHHLHESVMQRSFRDAVAQTPMCSTGVDRA